MTKELEQSQKATQELIGSKIELVINSGLYKGSYPSRLEELDKDLIGVAHPTLRGALLPALRSTELLMKIEAPNCFYQATASVLRSTINVPLPLLWLKLETALEKVQRRMYVRVPSSLKGEAYFLGTDMELLEETPLPPSSWFAIKVADISLGGAGIWVKESMSRYCLEGGRYLLSLKIGNVSFFLVGKLVKILKKNEGYMEMGIAYEGLSSFIEKLMGGYIRQQELITRG